MGCKGQDKTTSVCGKLSSSHCDKDKYLHASGCHCPQRFDHSFPYKDLPPPAPPDGRTDLWDLQFCRWWGWNWVRKRDALVASKDKKEPRKTSLMSKSRDSDDDQSPGPSYKTKRASFSSKDPEIRQCQQPPLTAKEQFKAMCKCLLGKRNMPPAVAKLYNTPSNSMIAFGRQERESFRVCEKRCKSRSNKKSTKKHRKDGSSKDRHRSHKDKSPKRPRSGDDSTTPRSSRITDDLQYAYTRKCGSSTEGSIEYLTFRLQCMSKGEKGACPCQTQNVPTKVQPIAVATDELQELKETVVVSKHAKETQTYCTGGQKREETREKHCGPSEENCPSGSEKRVKLKRKKQKTICIMVCCCGSCQQKKINATQQDDANFNSDDHLQQDFCTQQADNTNICLQTDVQSSTSKQNSPKLFQSEKEKLTDSFMALPVSVPPLNTKILSKFGTPSKSYPWMQNIESDATTTALNDIASPAKDVEDWPSPDLLGINQDLTYLKQINPSGKYKDEDRILLDAVCDAILKEYDEATCPLLNELQYNDKNYDLGGMFGNMQNKTDVYTELSRALVNTEDVGIQLTKAADLTNILERSDASRLDTIMSDIMHNIFAKSKDSVGNANPDPYDFKKYTEDTQYRDFGFPKANPAPATVRKTLKRGATALDKEKPSCKKKLKQEEKGVALNGKMGDIFSKIEDIVLKSKAKTAEIQKGLDLDSRKRELSNTESENVLQIHNLTKNCKHLGLERGSNDNFLTMKTPSKRHYPMSSDTFKRFDTVQQTYCAALAQSIEEESCHLQDQCLSRLKEDSIGQDVQIKNTGMLNQKLSKLSVQSFIVCDEKSQVESKSSPACFSGRNIASKASLIPIRRRSNTEC